MPVNGPGVTAKSYRVLFGTYLHTFRQKYILEIIKVFLFELPYHNIPKSMEHRVNCVAFL